MREEKKFKLIVFIDNNSDNTHVSYHTSVEASKKKAREVIKGKRFYICYIDKKINLGSCEFYTSILQKDSFTKDKHGLPRNWS